MGEYIGDVGWDRSSGYWNKYSFLIYDKEGSTDTGMVSIGDRNHYVRRKKQYWRRLFKLYRTVFFM